VEDERGRREAEPLIEVIVVGEGQTEETFVRDVLAPVFGAYDVFLHARLISTSKQGKGGALSRERVVSFLRKTLRERADTYVTTLFDLYGLRPDFPGVADAAGGNPLVRCATHPSARLEQLRDPAYDKRLHGSRLAERIGIETMRSECSHFDAWLTHIEALPPLA
jgi:Domain of unknown function (DUF4276)